MFHNHLPTSDNMAKRNSPSNGTCVICSLGEDANHMFFHCHLAHFAWSAVREAFSQIGIPLRGPISYPFYGRNGAHSLGFSGVALGHCFGCFGLLETKLPLRRNSLLTQLMSSLNVTSFFRLGCRWGNSGTLSSSRRSWSGSDAFRSRHIKNLCTPQLILMEYLYSLVELGLWLVVSCFMYLWPSVRLHVTHFVLVFGTVLFLNLLLDAACGGLY